MGMNASHEPCTPETARNGTCQCLKRPSMIKDEILSTYKDEENRWVDEYEIQLDSGDYQCLTGPKPTIYDLFDIVWKRVRGFMLGTRYRCETLNRSFMKGHLVVTTICQSRYGGTFPQHIRSSFDGVLIEDEEDDREFIRSELLQCADKIDKSVHSGRAKVEKISRVSVVITYYKVKHT